MKKFEIFVITHKKIEYRIINNYIPIIVGEKDIYKKGIYLKDDSGDNICYKNNNYCELTAIYWLWKNYDLPKYIGVCHYRRFFVHGFFSSLINEKKVNKIMKSYDIILPKKNTVKKGNIYEHFINGKSGKERDLINLRKIISKNYPDYLRDYDIIMQSKSISYFNMMIISKSDYNKYCRWLFDILFELEKITDLTGYTIQQQRIYGFLSEFLLNVWVKHEQLKPYYCDVLFIEESKIKTFINRTKISIKRLIK